MKNYVFIIILFYLCSIFIINEKVVSQGDNNYCYLVTSSGKHISLSSICRAKKKKRKVKKSIEQSSLEDNTPIQQPKYPHYGQPRKKYSRY